MKVKDGDSARKRAVECMRLATQATCEERSEILRAMARSWVTLAIQMDRLEATKIKVKDTRNNRPPNSMWTE